eukprot:SAG31_NODE_1557_length_7884_cov_69.027357_3_plen_56_part_00
MRRTMPVHGMHADACEYTATLVLAAHWYCAPFNIINRYNLIDPDPDPDQVQVPKG